LVCTPPDDFDAVVAACGIHSPASAIGIKLKRQRSGQDSPADLLQLPAHINPPCFPQSSRSCTFHQELQPQQGDQLPHVPGGAPVTTTPGASMVEAADAATSALQQAMQAGRVERHSVSGVRGPCRQTNVPAARHMPDGDAHSPPNLAFITQLPTETLPSTVPAQPAGQQSSKERAEPNTPESSCAMKDILATMPNAAPGTTPQHGSQVDPVPAQHAAVACPTSRHLGATDMLELADLHGQIIGPVPLDTAYDLIKRKPASAHSFSARAVPPTSLQTAQRYAASDAFVPTPQQPSKADGSKRGVDGGHDWMRVCDTWYKLISLGPELAVWQALSQLPTFKRMRASKCEAVVELLLAHQLPVTAFDERSLGDLHELSTRDVYGLFDHLNRVNYAQIKNVRAYIGSRTSGLVDMRGSCHTPRSQAGQIYHPPGWRSRASDAL